MSDFALTPYTNSMARQLNGPIIQSLLKAKHNMFSADADELIDHRNSLSIDTVTTQELEWLGALFNIPRPYAVIDNEVVLADDEEYKLFFRNVVALRQSQSLLSLAEVFYQFLPNGEFQFEIQENGDIRVVIDIRYRRYLPFLQQAANSVYTASPRLQPFEVRDYFIYIFDHGFYLRYVQLAQPNFWEVEYNATRHSLRLNSRELEALTVGFDAGQLVPDPDQVGHYIPRESNYAPETAFVVENGVIKLSEAYITYNDASIQHTDGRGVFVRKPFSTRANPYTNYDVMYTERDASKPLPIESAHTALLMGYDPNSTVLRISNKRLAPTDYFTDKVANYGKQSLDNVTRSTLVVEGNTLKIGIYDVRRIATMNVTQE